MEKSQTERTETDDRVQENASPSPRVSIVKNLDDVDPSTGLPRGQHDDDRSPLDPGGPLDPTRGKAVRK